MLGFALPPRSLGPRKLGPAVGKHRLRRPTGVHWTPVVEPVGSNWIHPPAQIQKAPRGGLFEFGGGASLVYTAPIGKFPAQREFTGNTHCIAQAAQPISMTPCVIAPPTPYFEAMIKTFRSDETQKVWEGQRSRRLPSDIQQVARRKLRMLNNARTLDDLRVPPGNRLEPLGGDRADQHSIRINDQWRICFVWQDGNAVDVEIVDYH